MLKFSFVLINHRNEFLHDSFSYYKSCIYEYEGILTILADNKELFNGEIFILEFIRDCVVWLNSRNAIADMMYSCVDVDDTLNPLIRFIHDNETWHFQSPWQLFDCKTCFCREELEQAIRKLISDVEEQLGVSLPLSV